MLFDIEVVSSERMRNIRFQTVMLNGHGVVACAVGRIFNSQL